MDKKEAVELWFFFSPVAVGLIFALLLWMAKVARMPNPWPAAFLLLVGLVALSGLVWNVILLVRELVRRRTARHTTEGEEGEKKP